LRVDNSTDLGGRERENQREDPRSGQKPAALDRIRLASLEWREEQAAELN